MVFSFLFADATLDLAGTLCVGLTRSALHLLTIAPTGMRLVTEFNIENQTSASGDARALAGAAVLPQMGCRFGHGCTQIYTHNPCPSVFICGRTKPSSFSGSERTLVWSKRHRRSCGGLVPTRSLSRLPPLFHVDVATIPRWFFWHVHCSATRDPRSFLVRDQRGLFGVVCVCSSVIVCRR